MTNPVRLLLILFIMNALVIQAPSHSWAQNQGIEAERHFEAKIRPLLIERCYSCHSESKSKGGLRLDSRITALKGGESGTAIVPGEPDKSLLMQAVLHQGGLKMPPDGKLAESKIDDLARWIREGAVWPGASSEVSSSSEIANVVLPIPPNEGELAKSLQLWLRSDTLVLNDNEPVSVWPDQSGHGRDLSATKGVRAGGVGAAGLYVRESTIWNRPAVRFTTSVGMASSPDNSVDIRGDAALTLMVVMNLKRHETPPPFWGILGIGNPANAGNPGKPLAAVLQINQGDNHAFHFAGGWNNDAFLGSGSFLPYYDNPTLLTVVKTPGPMRQTTRIFFNGLEAQRVNGEPLEGTDAIPDIQHRRDIGVFLGKALGWCGSVQGDIGEVVVYNAALSNSQRIGVENEVAERFGMVLNPSQNLAARADYSDEERGYWAYQPVRDPAVPVIQGNGWVQSAIDRFILSKLDELHLSPSPPADRLTLLRRATFDLTGLPPTPDEVSAFLSDQSPQAFEKVVDRLLASEHYGECWGRHWLDVVRYAETTANDANAVMRYAWRYRNFVIDAFNRDVPYDQFVTEQLAGDLLPASESPEDNARRVIATGYLMVGPKALAETDKEQSRLDIVDDQIDVTGRAILGLTLSCARCHDHKFDAIRTTDYYALAGVFRSTEPFMDLARNASMWWEFPVAQGEGREPLIVMAPKEANSRNLRVHLRGNRFNLGKIVPRGVPGIISASADTLKSSSDLIDLHQSSSGRLQLARWISSPSNPLTARVMVNRIWQHHFHRGIVATSDNFGTRGDRPSHPELLDWLATRFMESGWSVKTMHRIMMLSSSYQQGRSTNSESLERDPEGVWRSSYTRRRLTAEEIRDAILSVSGTLDPVRGTSESSEAMMQRAENVGAISPNRMGSDDPYYAEFRKRSIYLPVVRNMLSDILALFDAADPNNVTSVRNETTVASQSLFLLNSPFVLARSKSFAERLLGNVEQTEDQRVDLAHRLAYGRSPTRDELIDAREFLAEYQAASSRSEEERRLAAWQSYCQTLICANEFLYVE